MNICCLDLEGVLVPEIWIEFAKATNIPELTRTTRDEPNYDKLMRFRCDMLAEHGLGIQQIEKVIAGIEPYIGAREFLDELRSKMQVVIVSDTFESFARPLMKKLGWPTIFCNELVIADDGTIKNWVMRCENTKLTTIRALQSMGYKTLAAGDSFNDIEMIQNSNAGFLFRTTPEIAKRYPEIECFETYEELLAAFERAL